jgi:hypothetical protein
MRHQILHQFFVKKMVERWRSSLMNDEQEQIATLMIEAFAKNGRITMESVVQDDEMEIQ